MINFVKRNKLIIIFLIIILFVIIGSTINYKNEFNSRILLYEKICKDISIDSDKSKDEHEVIKDIECGKDIRLSIMGNYRQAFNNNMVVLFDYGLPIMVIILIALYFGRRFRSGYLQNELVRNNYKSVLKKYLMNSYLLSLIIPVTGLIILISFSFISNIHATTELYGFYDLDALATPAFYLNKTYLYYGIFIFNLFLYGLYISNIYFIVSRKVKNIITSIIGSYLVFNVMNIFLSNAIGVGVAYLLYYLFKYEKAPFFIDYFNPQMVWRIHFLDQPLFLTIILFIIVIISLVFVRNIYNNKESVVIESEK